ncbi:hypothetical protein [Paracraurococcus ruber]|uniref:Uncharacterized protein n=1 Tax=Paracraurococcus ruber TaxID=77675 RepID=A0ABS1CWG5_9PROT|nr:hypothetical protein [Paracraurococcus ruber]MBK1658581.1 hypothetical protein [Paracraurococcus ruber]TDG27425.1 hypothetical protein E2C05_22960 [Paracraurococcus ruber]
MRRLPQATDAETDSTDHSALRLMLSYVEAECLRMGATDAARHAALAASLMPETPKAPPPVTDQRILRRPRGARLH